MPTISAPRLAKDYLRGAAYRLGASNPIQLREVSNALDESLQLPVGHPAYRSDPPLNSSFAEERAGNLDLVMKPLGPRANALDRTEAATRTMEDIVGGQFGREALRWLSGRAEPFVGGGGRHIRWGAHLGTSFDRNGVRESIVTYELGPDQMDGFPDALYRLARVAMGSLPQLRPAYSSIRCGRTSGSQQIIFAVDAPLALSSLQPMMEALGLGDKHASLMSAVAFILGARYTLPPDSCSIAIRPVRDGVEMRLDINLERVPDLPQQLMSLLRLQMGERPQSLRALDSWLIAMTPEGYDWPGTLNILSVCVRPDMPARVSLHLRPPVLETEPDNDNTPDQSAFAPPTTVVTDSSGLSKMSSAVFAYPR
jgi:hypothetical protein